MPHTSTVAQRCKKKSSQRLSSQIGADLRCLLVVDGRDTVFLQGPGGHIKPIPDGEDFAAGAPPAMRAQTGTDHEALDRALAVRLQQASSVGTPIKPIM